ncbi:hypothetical protein [Sphingobacterium bovistauri]|uniref:Uncharacterized protein n=1 Tax=Sphingobacterium bovistauri TaxID=2781959 RepID=A0ABS7Z3M2_9SPHI|nr:hypothetical protein [Sphingobacterium bovistauri]MCA5004187.1 hypothetical protein [Sphingobacterium bovistauri]
MKRFAIIIAVLMVTTLVLTWTLYTLRKNDIKDQYVSSSSTRILSIAVDDLLLDNISNLYPWRDDKSKGKKQRDSWLKKLIFDAGIKIPARIYSFSTDAHQNQFFGILAVKNYDDCFSFFATEYPDGINFIDKEKGIVNVVVNKHINVLFNYSHIIYNIALGDNLDLENLQSMLLQPDTWTQISALNGFENTLSTKHITYMQKDGRLTLEGTVSSDKTEINGKWLLSQNLDDNLLVREMDSLEQTLTFWNLIPLNEIPLLSKLMNKFTGLAPEQLNSNYFDLQIYRDPTSQQDSSISYVYDDDFNATEETKILEVAVPSIVHTWSYDEILEKSLPNKMFYRFNKKRIGPYLLNTTLETFPHQATRKATKHPLYLSVNFETWPEMWSIPILDRLKAKKVKATVSTTLHNKNEIHLNGQISY